jgi:hypothetical protein
MEDYFPFTDFFDICYPDDISSFEKYLPVDWKEQLAKMDLLSECVKYRARKLAMIKSYFHVKDPQKQIDMMCFKNAQDGQHGCQHHMAQSCALLHGQHNHEKQKD